VLTSTIASVALFAGAAGAQPGAGVTHEGTTFRVVATIPTPSNPHGAAFSPDGRTAYIACSGADEVIALDLETREIARRHEAPLAPLDVALAPEGDALLVSQFAGASIVRLELADGATRAVASPGEGPSLFSRPGKRGARYLVSEHADVVTEIAPDGAPLRRWETGDRPYPGDVTSDGILLFVPNRDEGSVTVVDTLNDRIAATTPVGERPEGGAVTPDDALYIGALGGADSLTLVSTASFEVIEEIDKGVGPRPFSVTMAGADYALVNNAGGETLSVLHLPTRRVVGRLPVGEIPIVVRAHPDGRRFLVMCEGSHHVAIVERIDAPEPRAEEKTEVLVLGMIHSGHRDSERYGLDLVREIVREFNPDEVFIEIPPNRMERAMRQWQDRRAIEEPRVRVFPEYTDALFPLLDEMDFRIIPTAGWTAEMNDYRRRRLAELSEDPARADEWAAHQQAMTEMRASLEALGPADDPALIHTDDYDRIIDKAYAGPYNRFFNDDLADGGWDNINAKHYAHIARRLDKIRGQGRRVLITYGAAHKGWFLQRLRRRPDVVLIEAGPVLDAAREALRDAPADRSR